MIIHDCKQGSQEWLKLRAGIPTASAFDRIITPGGKPSRSWNGYLHECLAERIIGKPTVKAMTMWMSRGTELEAEAVAFYEFQRDCKTMPVGFITNDERTVGASPDRLILDDDDTLLEIKVPSEGIHVGYLIAAAGASEEYKVQTQGQLWVTGRKHVDILSYHPEMPGALFRIERDEEFIEKLGKSVMEFSRVLENLSRDFTERGWIKEKAGEPVADPFISQADIDWAMNREDLKNVNS